MSSFALLRVSAREDRLDDILQLDWPLTIQCFASTLTHLRIYNQKQHIVSKPSKLVKNTKFQNLFPHQKLRYFYNQIQTQFRNNWKTTSKNLFYHVWNSCFLLFCTGCHWWIF